MSKNPLIGRCDTVPNRRRAVVQLDSTLLLSLWLGICGGLLVWGITLAQSQIQFDTDGWSVGAPGPGRTVTTLVHADLDNDGDADLVSGDSAGYIVAWRNDGSPFGSGWNRYTIGSRSAWLISMAAGDMDDDGDVDLVAGYRDATVVVWVNNGTLSGWGHWVVGSASVWVNALQVGDVDGDGSLDIVSGGGNSSISVPPTSDNRITIWLNGPPWVPWTSVDVGEAYYAVRSLALGDLDSDDDLDIVFGTNHAPPIGSEEDPVPREEWPDVYQIRAFRNDGLTSWYEINVGRDPELETLTVQYHGYWGASISSVSPADLDNDGDLDIVSTDHMEGDFQVMGWENDGSPFSGPETLWRGSAISVGPYHNWLFSSVLDSAPGDFDGDGDIDVATANAYTADGQAEVMVWENTGIAFHEVVSQTHWLRHDIGEFGTAVNAVVVQAADLDLDDNLDLATAGYTDSPPHAIMVWENTKPIDSDGDGLSDDDEINICGTNPNDPDTDGDGIDDMTEVGNPTAPHNSDDDALIDALDTDSDNDGIPDADEWDEDQDASNYDDLCINLSIDQDGDGTPNCQDNDADGGGLSNYRDTDSDRDGKTDEVEGSGDSDGDGIKDFLDPNDAYLIYMSLILRR